MATLTYSSLSDFSAFANTFIPGGFIFPTPRYRFIDSGNGKVTYIHIQDQASTRYYNINPSVTLFGPDLRANENGGLSGTVTSFTFASENRGEIATVSGVSGDGALFTNILTARINGDNIAGSAFTELLGGAISVLTLGAEDDRVFDRGLFKAVNDLDLGAGNDSFFAGRPRDTDRSIDGGAGYDTLILDDFGRPDRFVVDLRQGRIIADETSFAFTGFEVIKGDAFVDRYIGSSAGDNVQAAGSDDRILGFGGNDTLNGGYGDDLLRGHSGRDRIHGAAGEDTLYGGVGDDTLWGGSQNDRLSGAAGKDRLFGGSGKDRLFGGTGDDLIKGGNSRDRLFGGSGNDTLDGGGGNDILRGGAGADTFVFKTFARNDRIKDFSISDGDQIQFVSSGDWDFDTQSLTLTDQGLHLTASNVESDTIRQVTVRLDEELLSSISIDSLEDSIIFA